MNKIAQYLQSHLVGEVLTSSRARKFFATDASILQQVPSVVIYPRNTSDVRKIARFCWQLAEKGHVLPITARGRGSDVTGAAVGSGAIVVFPAHMNRLLELDTKQRLLRAQPGMSFRSLQDVLHSHGLFLPAYPSSIDYASIGGAIANNSGGEKSLKYGVMRDFVQNLEVVLANGDIIQTSRISARELNQKKGLDSFEGELYRQLDNIVTDNEALLKDVRSNNLLSKNSTGYGLEYVKGKGSTFDLTPLFVGSQGTLGLVVEAIIAAEVHNPKASLIVLSCSNYEDVQDVVTEARKLDPSAVEMIDRSLLEVAMQTNKNVAPFIDPAAIPQALLFVEFNDDGERKQSAKIKKLRKLIKGKAEVLVETNDYEEQQDMWILRRSAAAMMLEGDNKKAAVPLIEDGIVPVDHLAALLKGVNELLEKHHVDGAMWGRVGEGNLHVQPLLDLSVLSDRQKTFRLMADYQTLVQSLGGSMSGEHGEGRLRAHLVKKQVGDELYGLYEKVKHVFDPHGILNPGVKIQNDVKEVIPMLRENYDVDALHDFLPHR